MDIKRREWRVIGGSVPVDSKVVTGLGDDDELFEIYFHKGQWYWADTDCEITSSCPNVKYWSYIEEKGAMNV